jgi:type IV secretory pathway VirB2 component (pilin)
MKLLSRLLPLCVPGIAFAGSDVTQTLTNFLGYLTGAWGKVIAALAIVGIGYACFFLGKVHKGYVVAVVVGIGLVFGAQEVLSHITGV